jgi:hypothetical protein
LRLSARAYTGDFGETATLVLDQANKVFELTKLDDTLTEVECCAVG